MEAAPPPRPGADPPLALQSAVEGDVQLVGETDFAGARVACPACGTTLEPAREHCFGCGAKVVGTGAAPGLETVRKRARDVYLLMALSLFFAVPAVAALALAYADRGKARGTWLDSHFEWQVETLWGVFWLGVAVLAGGWLGSRFLGTGEWMLLAGLPALAWYAHRIVKGWTRLGDSEPVTE